MPIATAIVARACLGIGTAACLVLVAAQPSSAQSASTTFFVTSTGIGNGANLGGLAGADNHCQALAQAAGIDFWKMEPVKQ